MDEGSAKLREPRYRPQEGFRVWAGQVDGAVDVYADTGVTVEQLTNALALYVQGGARLVEVKAPDSADGANLFRFSVAPDVPRSADGQAADPNGRES